MGVAIVGETTVGKEGEGIVLGGVVVPLRAVERGEIMDVGLRPWFLSCFWRIIKAAAWPVIELEERTAEGVITPFLRIGVLRLLDAFVVFFAGGFAGAVAAVVAGAGAASIAGAGAGVVGCATGAGAGDVVTVATVLITADAGAGARVGITGAING